MRVAESGGRLFRVLCFLRRASSGSGASAKPARCSGGSGPWRGSNLPAGSGQRSLRSCPGRPAVPGSRLRPPSLKPHLLAIAILIITEWYFELDFIELEMLIDVFFLPGCVDDDFLRLFYSLLDWRIVRIVLDGGVRV